MSFVIFPCRELRYSVFVIRYSLFGIRYSVFVIRDSLFVILRSISSSFVHSVISHFPSFSLISHGEMSQREQPVKRVFHIHGIVAPIAIKTAGIRPERIDKIETIFFHS